MSRLLVWACCTITNGLTAQGTLGELIGTQIPLIARIVAVADAFGDLLVGRSTSPSLEFFPVLVAWRQDSGTHLDPEMVARFTEPDMATN